MEHIPTLHIEAFEQEVLSTEFYCNELAAHLENNRSLIHKPHSHDFYLCVIFTEGSGFHEIDFNRYTVAPGSVFFLKPGQVHFWNFSNPPKGYIFFHTKEFYELRYSHAAVSNYTFYANNYNPPKLQLSDTAIAPIAQRFAELYTTQTKDFQFKVRKLVSLIALIYIDLNTLYNANTPSGNVYASNYLQTFYELERCINQYYKTEKSAQFYANQLHRTTKHINRISKELVNKTTTQLITERVILEAKRQLVHSDNSLTDICFDLGFEDYAYFSRLFKKYTGNTPSSFKKDYNL